MRQLYHLPLVGLLVISFIPNQLCTICEVNEKSSPHLNSLLNTMIINSKNISGSQSASVLLSLRLAGFQNQSLTQHLFQQIRSDVVRKDINLSSGQLALIILALGACKDASENLIYEHHLINQLETKFQEEIKHMKTHNGNPLTNRYQLSLSILALCLLDGKYSTTDVVEVLNPKNKNFFLLSRFSVDTGAMAVLALTCVKRSLISGQIRADQNKLNTINNYIRSVMAYITYKIKENGVIGNIHSTGEAMQALFVTSGYYKEWNCKQTQDKILKSISENAFSLSTAAAQVLPALLGKTYLDVNKDAPCVHGLGNFHISIQVPKTNMPTRSPLDITVHYSVHGNELYSTDITVPKGSSFLDVMKAAQKQDENTFSFTVYYNKRGPYIHSVQGESGSASSRTHWEFLSEGELLTQGVGDYVVHDGENLLVRLSKY